MLQKDRILKNTKDEPENEKKDTSNSQLFNRWVEKHQIASLKEPENVRKIDSRQKNRSDFNVVNRQRF